MIVRDAAVIIDNNQSIETISDQGKSVAAIELSHCLILQSSDCAGGASEASFVENTLTVWCQPETAPLSKASAVVTFSKPDRSKCVLV